PEAAGYLLLELFPQPRRVVEQDRGVGLDPVAVVAAQQARHGLAERLAHEIPQGDVQAADGVLDRAAAAVPEGVLPQLLADALRLEDCFAQEHRLEMGQRRLDKRQAGEAAADAGRA